ncbi:MAG TPA: hypothetical protein VFT95_05190 [Micromonosporaceae bacterium]|nr:hypothetical protein [Micromonosporaceae bacterium]
MNGYRWLIAAGALARLAALLSYLAADPPVGPSVGPGPAGVGTVTLFALYAAGGMALLAAVPWSAGRADPRGEQAVLVKGVVSLGLAAGVALFGATHALVSADPVAYALIGTCAAADLTATGLGVGRLHRWSVPSPR